MKVIGVIPARIGSTRFPRKPLALIQGKPMIQWVIEATQRSKIIEHIVLATDDQNIAEVGARLGVESVMTPPELPSGTDRIYYATKNMKYDIIVNIQGDEPLLQVEALDTLVKSLSESSTALMATLGHKISLENLSNPQVVKVLVNQFHRAIYFSRAPIPFTRMTAESLSSWSDKVLHHIGLYAFRKSFLEEFCHTETSVFEQAEGLEQLRALDMGGEIVVSKVDFESQSVDTPEDIAKVEKLLEISQSKTKKWQIRS